MQLEGTLTAAQAGRLAAHLAGCADCARLAGEEQSLHHRLLADVEPIWTMTPAEAAHNRAQIQRRLRRKNFMLQTRQTIQGAAALVLILLLTAGVFWWQLQGDVQTADSEPQPAATETITLTMAGFPAFQSAYETLAQQFHEGNPTINIQYVALDEQAHSLSLPEQAALADVVVLNGRPSVEAASFFLDLTPLAADERAIAGDFWPGLLQACQAGGVQIGLPLSASVDLIFYDKRAFDAAGLPYPQPGWDWLTFRQAAQSLTNQQGAETTRYGFVDVGRPLSLLGPFVDALLAGNENSLDADRLAAELDWYVDFARAGVMPVLVDDPQTAVFTRDTLIRSRQAAMWLGSQFELDTWQETFGDDLGIVSFPANGAAGNPAQPTCAAISAGSAQPQAAWAWLHFLSTQPVTGIRPEAPARSSVAQSSGFWAEMEDEKVVALRSALEQGWYGGGAGQALTAVNDALLQAISGQTTLADTLPVTVARQPTALPPTPDSTPVAVATPRTTPTPVGLPGNGIDTDSVIVVDYYVRSNGHSSQAAIEALARAFNEAQDSIEVRIGTAFGGSYLTEVADNYDCLAWEGSAGDYAMSFPEFTDKFYSLTPLVDGEAAAFLEDFHPVALETNRVDGELYGLPAAFNPLLIRYNAGLFAELGLEAPAPDWTVDDFWALAASAARNEDGRTIYGFAPAVGTRYLAPLMYEGMKLYDAESWPPTAVFTEPAAMQGVTRLAEMVEAGVLFPAAAGGSRDTWEQVRAEQQQQQLLINSGQVAMWIASAGLHTDYYSFQTGVAPFPVSAVELGGPVTTLYISRRAENPAGCWEWLKFLSVQPDAFNSIPVRDSVLRSDGWTAVVGQETAAAYQVILSRLTVALPDAAVIEHSIVTYPYTLWWVDALQQVYDGAGATAVLAEMQRRADAYRLCMIDAVSVNSEQMSACARQADPEFQQAP